MSLLNLHFFPRYSGINDAWTTNPPPNKPHHLQYIYNETALKKFLADQHNPANAKKSFYFRYIPDVFSLIPLHLTAVGQLFEFQYNLDFVRVVTAKKVVVHTPKVKCTLAVFDTSLLSYDIYIPTLTHIDVDAIEKWTKSTKIILRVTTKPSQDIVDRVVELSKKLNILVMYI